MIVIKLLLYDSFYLILIQLFVVCVNFQDVCLYLTKSNIYWCYLINLSRELNRWKMPGTAIFVISKKTSYRISARTLMWYDMDG